MNEVELKELEEHYYKLLFGKKISAIHYWRAAFFKFKPTNRLYDKRPLQCIPVTSDTKKIDFTANDPLRKMIRLYLTSGQRVRLDTLANPLEMLKLYWKDKF